MVPIDSLTHIVGDVLDALGVNHPEPMRLRAIVEEAAGRHDAAAPGGGGDPAKPAKPGEPTQLPADKPAGKPGEPTQLPADPGRPARPGDPTQLPADPGKPTPRR